MFDIISLTSIRIKNGKGENAKKIKAANEKWLNPTPRKKPKYSFSQLNRMAEWKRLHDDEFWTKRFNAKRG